MPVLAATAADFVNLAALAVAFFLLIFGAFFSGFLRALGSRKWPTTPGKVVESRVRENTTPGTDSSSESTSYVPFVRYTYVVASETRESKQIAIGEVSGSRAAAEQIVAKYPLGATVTVHHHPKLHYLAVLEPGRWVLPLLATLISGFVLYCAVGFWLNKSLHPHVGPWAKARAKAAAERAGK